MTLGRARILKAKVSAHHATAAPARSGALARRVPAAVVDAHAEAARIVSEATRAADVIVSAARASVADLVRDAVRDAREHEVSRVAAELIALRVDEEQRAERTLDRTIEIAVLLAERLIGDAIVREPVRAAALAEGALKETRGARRMRIEACQDDVPALEAMLAGVAEGVATIEVSQELARGSFVVHTELGRIDARLAPQLERLAEALRVAMQRDPASQRGRRQ